MDHLTVEEHGVAERYLLGRLAPEEAADFEAHYLDCPECLERLELGRRLRQGLREVAAEERSRLAVAVFAGWRLRRKALGAALAAVAVAAVVVPWVRLASERDRATAELSEILAPRAGLATFSLSPERGAAGEEPSTVIALGPAPEWLVLALEPPPAAGAETYEVRLLDGEGTLLWRSAPVSGDASGRVTVGVHSSWLRPGVHVAELATVVPGGPPRPAGRYAFRVRPAAD